MSHPRIMWAGPGAPWGAVWFSGEPELTQAGKQCGEEVSGPQWSTHSCRQGSFLSVSGSGWQGRACLPDPSSGTGWRRGLGPLLARLMHPGMRAPQISGRGARLSAMVGRSPRLPKPTLPVSAHVLPPKTCGQQFALFTLMRAYPALRPKGLQEAKCLEGRFQKRGDRRSRSRREPAGATTPQPGPTEWRRVVGGLGAAGNGPGPCSANSGLSVTVYLFALICPLGPRAERRPARGKLPESSSGQIFHWLWRALRQTGGGGVGGWCLSPRPTGSPSHSCLGSTWTSSCCSHSPVCQVSTRGRFAFLSPALMGTDLRLSW
uniref:Uncharacterized protein LOC123616928 n=1 Tax=Camelus bactrianus TaxID=9837 RepID=A0A9W3HID5_CAMBA|nr:uncharacterized protein LOC123616928 [Camelus bactrianus]